MQESNNQYRRVGVIMLHGACSMSCLFCITENAVREMNKEDVKEVLSIMKGREMESVVFGGGEPLQWGYDLSEVIHYAKSIGFYTQVGTNGVGLTQTVIDQLDADRYVLPVDSIHPMIHNYLRSGFRNHYDIIQKRLRNLVEKSISFTISTVVCRVNAEELNGMASYLFHLWEQGAKIHAWHLYRFLPFGRNGRKNIDMLNISYKDYIEKTEHIKQRDLPFFVYRRPNMQLSKEVDFFWLEDGGLKIGSEVWVKQCFDEVINDR